MKVIIEPVNTENSELTNDLIKRKLNKLDQFFDKIISANVFLKELNISSKENKSIEVRLSIPGDDIVVKKTSVTFKKCIDVVMDSLKRTLKRHKEKIQAR